MACRLAGFIICRILSGSDSIALHHSRVKVSNASNFARQTSGLFQVGWVRHLRVLSESDSIALHHDSDAGSCHKEPKVFADIRNVLSQMRE